MYQLFEAHSYQPGGALLFPEFLYGRRGLQGNLEKVIDYHRINPHGLNGSHFLVKLLQSINVTLTLPPDVYNDKVTDLALNLAMSLKMTSALSRGKVFQPGVFYGANVTEVILASIDTYDTSLLIKEWESLCPIRVIYHPKTDLNLVMPDGKRLSDEPGYAVIVVNIPMLASQYRMWRLADFERNDDSPMNVMQFLTMYPLPNMLYSHLDVTLMNRLIHQFFDADMPKFKNPNPFYLTDYSKDVDKTLAHYLEVVKNRGWDFDTMLSLFPTVTAADFHDVIKPPAMAFSLQLQWGIAMARLPLIAFLVQLNYTSGNERNQWYLNQIRRWLRQFDLNKALYSALPRYQYDGAISLIERGILPYL